MMQVKRILKACLEQTIKFEVYEEYTKYVTDLEKRNTQYKIVDEAKQSDGSVIIKIKKQYNSYPCEEYLA